MNSRGEELLRIEKRLYIYYEKSPVFQENLFNNTSSFENWLP